MTGFGRGAAQFEGREITVELKSVNHRFLDLSPRMPRSLSFTEDSIRRHLQSKFARGHIDIHVFYKNERDDAKEAVMDRSIVSAYMAAAEALTEMGVPGELDINAVMRLPEALRILEKDDDMEAISKLLSEALDSACAQMLESRLAEGLRLKEDITSRLNLIARKREQIALREPSVVLDYKERLHLRIEALLDGVEPDEARLAQEVALFAEKASIAEELTRLRAHIDSMISAMESNEPMGRRLDFIVQELNREANTIGSKASDMEILSLVVDIKAEIEKIREQVQNIQ
ncbi:MAG: YicC/YloC family endoribonuclease [Christensenellales bacterium]